MASFTDKSPQFNPYIQQLPVDAMVQVGVQKQSLYNQGIQRIQSQIDSVAGLDIMKDADKSYLQSKLNSLGNDLKLVAAGDFSDFQLVNSVGGIVNQVGRDPNIQNAVNSTAKIRKEYQLMEEDRTNGKYAPNNQRDFMEQVSSYLDNDIVGQSFSGNYSPFVDVNQHLFDIAKEVGIDEITAQQLWETDASGNIITDANGMPKWNPVMAEKHLKGKDPAKILRAFQTALTAADYNQLAIDGKYKYEGLSQQGLTELIKNNYTANLDKIDDRMKNLQIALFKETSKNVKDIDKIKSIGDQLEYLSNQRGQFERGMENDLTMIDKDPSRVRSNLYINNYLGNMASSLSEMTEETTYSVSPQFEVSMKINEFNRNLERDRIKDKQWYADYLLKASANDLAWKKFALENLPTSSSDDVLYESLDAATDKFVIKNAVENSFEARTMRFNEINKTIARELYKQSGLVKRGNELGSVYDKRVDEEMDANIPAGINADDYYAQFAAGQIDEWKTGEGIPTQFQSLVSEQYKLSKDLYVQANKINAVKKTAREIAYARGLNIPTDAEIERNISDIELDINGDIITIPKDDVMDFVVYNNSGVFSSNDKVANSNSSYKRLYEKYGMLLPIINSKLNAAPKSGSVISGMGSTFGRVSDAALDFARARSYFNSFDVEDLAEIEAQLYIDEGTIPQRQSVPVMQDKLKDQDFANRLNSIIDIYARNLTGTKGVRTEDLTNIALGNGLKMAKAIATPGMSEYTPTKYTLLLQGEGTDVYPLEINEDDYRYLTDRDAVKYEGVPSVVEQIKQYGTTALNGGNDIKDAWYESSQFTGIQGVDYKIVGNYIKDIGNPNDLIFEMYKIQKDEKGNQIINRLELDRRIPIMSSTGAYNTTLDQLPREITPEIIELLEKRK